MRIRSTKPEFWRSRRVASVSWDARLVLKGLESYVDDNGVGKDDIAMIVGDIFARDMFASPAETVARVSEAISKLHEAGLVWRYEVDGTDLLYIAFWESIQRIDKPGKGRFRRPDGTSEYGESFIRESVARARETVAPGTGEQGNRGTGEQGTDAVASEPPRDDVERICTTLADQIEATGSKRPTVTARWRTEARLMLDKDERTEDQVHACIRWLFTSTHRDAQFWRTNIRAMPKLRAEYDRLRQLAERQTGQQRRNDIDWDLAMERASAMGGGS